MKLGLHASLPSDWRMFVLVIALLLSLIGPSATAADAHALLDRSEPAPGTVVPDERPPHRISLWFTEPVEVTFNAVAVLDGSNRRVDRLNARVAREEPTRVDVDLGELSQGAYVVRYQVTSADNHVIRGTYWFGFGFAAAPPARAVIGSDAPTAAVLEVAARWLGLAAVLTLAGASFFRLLVAWPVGARLPSLPGLLSAIPYRRMRAVWALVLGLFVAAQLLWAMAQAEAIAGVPAPQALDNAVLGLVFFASRFAQIWWGRLLLGLLVGGMLLYQVGRDRQGVSGRTPIRLAAGASLVLLLLTSLSSHAPGARVFPPLAIAVDAVHLAAAALWLGGLVQLGLLLPPALALAGRQHRSALLKELVPRFSNVALGSVVVLLVSGLFTSVVQVASFEALATTAYGHSLLVKLALLVPLLGIAAFNLLIVRPRAAAGRAGADERLPRRFHKLVVAEAVIGASVLLVAGLLTSVPPPALQTFPAPIETFRQAGDLRVGLRVDPNWVGISRFRVTLTDAQGRAPSDVSNVLMVFTMEGMNMGRTTVGPEAVGDGVYEAEGFYLGMPGVSQIGVAVVRTVGRDQNVVFQIEVPNLNAKQFGGLQLSLGIGPLGLFGLAIGLFAVLGLTGARRELEGRLAPLAPAGAALVLSLGGGMFLADRSLASGAAPELSGNPVAASPASLTRGQGLYLEQCSICHGEAGIGDGPAAAALLPPPADLTLHARWHADEQLFWFVSHGVAGTAMVGFQDRLGAGERWDVINYLHELAQAPTATAARPATPRPPRPAPKPAEAAPRQPPAAGPTGPTLARPPAVATAATGDLMSTEGLSGRLVYGPDRDINLWVIRLPAGKPEQLTKFGAREFSSSPAWSPDGQQIAFSYYRLPRTGTFPVPEGTDLYLINADGSGLRMLAKHDVRGAVLQHPAWAADGSAIYVSYQGRGPDGRFDNTIDRVDVASGERTRVLSDAGYPALSRDGQRLAFVRFPTSEVKVQTLWWSAPDGSNPQEVLGPDIFFKYSSLRFSPDGQRLLFAAVGAGTNYRPPTAVSGLLGLLGRAFGAPVAYANGDEWDLWAIDLDGRNLGRLTILAEDLPVGAWSPEGKHVAFLGGGSASTAQTGLTVVGADGQGLRRLTTRPGHRGLDWAAAK